MPDREFASAIRKVFWGPNGLRAGWRFVSYVVLSVLFGFVISAGLYRVPLVARILSNHIQDVLTAPFALIIFSVVFLADVVSALVMSRIERRPFGKYGIPPAGAFGKLFWQGALGGIVAMSAVMLTIYAGGGFSLHGFALSGFAAIKSAVLWTLACVLTGLAEEFRYRGYSQFTLTTGIGFWPSAFALSTLFGAKHLLDNPGESWLGALAVLVFALFACFTLRRTGNLWFAIGWHAAWDFAQSFIFSVSNSGLRPTASLLKSTVHGPSWLTGGAVGPEGSLLTFVCLGLSFLLVDKLYPSKNNSPADSSATFSEAGARL